MSERSVVLRDMLPSDLRAVSDVWVEAWNAAYPAIDFATRRDWFGAHLAGLEAAGAQRLVALVGDDIAGLVTLDPATGYLDQIVVARGFQGCGVAERLLNHAQHASPGNVTLDVNQDNAPALRFYEKHGFAVVGEGANARGAPTYRMQWRDPGPAPATAASGQAASNCSLASRA